MRGRGLLGAIVLIWLLIGVVAAYQRDYFKTDETTDAVSFGDIIDSELGDQIQKIFILAFQMVTGTSNVKTLSWSWLMTKFIEKDEEF